MTSMIFFDELSHDVCDRSGSWIRHRANLSIEGTSTETAKLRRADGYVLVRTNSDNARVDIRHLLQRFPSASMLHIKGNEVNLDQLPQFSKLRFLWVMKTGKAQEICLKSLSRLQKLTIDSFAGITSFESESLESLIIYRAKSQLTDLDFLQKFPRLKRLWLIGGRYTNLDGLRHVPELLNLRLVDLRQLGSLDGIQHSAGTLKQLEVDGCSGAQDIEKLSALSDLRSLTLFNRKQIPCLSFCRGMENLRFICFPRTDVLDGKISELIHAPALDHAVFSNKRHFDLKEAELNDYLDYAE